MKRLVAAVAGFAVLTSFLAPMAQARTMRDAQNDLWASAPQSFTDIRAGHANYKAVAMLTEDEVIGGYADGTFKPDGSINRAELTKMVVAWMAQDMDLSSYKNCFPDVKTEWFAPYICYAKSQGWVSGYPDGTFKPAAQVNRVEAMKITLNVMIPSAPLDYWPAPTEAEKQLPSPTDAAKDAWYMGYLSFAIAKELLDGQHVTGDENAFFYKPGESMTRKEVAEMMYRVWLYMAERLEYVEVLQMISCAKFLQKDETDEEIHAAWVANLEAVDMTEEDANILEAKYGQDDVMQEMLLFSVKNTCGGGTEDLSKYEFIISKYAR